MARRNTCVRGGPILNILFTFNKREDKDDEVVRNGDEEEDDYGD